MAGNNIALRHREDIPADLASMVRIGSVIDVDLAEARCVVRFGDPDDPEPGETPPIRWLAPRAGLTRIWSPPSIGEQVLLIAPDGQLGAAVAVMGIVQDAFPPLGNSETEQIEFADGARIEYDPALHALKAVLPAGGTAQLDAPGGITLRGPVAIEGDVSITGAATVSQTLTAAADVIADGVSLKSHVHSGVSSGTAKTAPPD